jgi:hypothetical protein
LAVPVPPTSPDALMGMGVENQEAPEPWDTGPRLPD